MQGDRRIEGVINEPEQTDAHSSEKRSYRQKNIFKILKSLSACGFMFYNLATRTSYASTFLFQYE
jgi:hypothetical protein